MRTTKQFNRHEEMTPLTRDLILDLIRNPKFRDIQNNLYGLYDGYFYGPKLQAKANDTSLPTEDRIQLQSLIDTIKGYKTLKEIDWVI